MFFRRFEKILREGLIVGHDFLASLPERLIINKGIEAYLIFSFIKFEGELAILFFLFNKLLIKKWG